MPDHAPSASPRFSFGKASLRIVSVSGMTIAPPIPWIGAGGDQGVHARRERGRGGRSGEEREAEGEDAPAPEAVTERRAGEQQDGERQGVGVDRPLELLERGVEVSADHRKRGRDDEVVEHDHEQGQ